MIAPGDAPGPGFVLKPSDGQADALVLLLHGVGATAASLAPLGRVISQALPQAAVAAFDAPKPFDLGPAGFQWFSVAGVTEANRAGRVAAALPDLEALIARERARFGLPAERVGVVGFSQGAIMSLHLAATAKVAPAVVAALAGRLAAGPIAIGSGRRPAVLMSHGLSDQVVSARAGEAAAAELGAAGLQVEFEGLPGQGHSISPSQMLSVAQHLQKHLASRPAGRQASDEEEGAASQADQRVRAGGGRVP